MADGELASALDEALRTVSMGLQPTGGRIFAHNARPGDLNHQTLELKCHWSDDNWFNGTSVVVGDEVHPRHTFHHDEFDDDEDKPRENETGWWLNSIPIMLSIYKVDEKWLAESAAKRNGEPIFGTFKYNEKINTSDGVVNDKFPTCSAWIGVGDETFAMIRDWLLGYKKYELQVGIDVTFPPGETESGFMGRRIAWDGKATLPITKAVAVWQKEDWRSNVQMKTYRDTPKRREEEYVAPREHVEALEASKRVEAAVSRLATPMWLVFTAMLVYLWLHR